jgi:hypothetical protein
MNTVIMFLFYSKKYYPDEINRMDIFMMQLTDGSLTNKKSQSLLIGIFLFYFKRTTLWQSILQISERF